MREAIKKQILKELEIPSSLHPTLKPKNINQLSNEIEEEIFITSGKNSKDKMYRELAKRLINRFKGSSKSDERFILKFGLIEVKDFVKCSDKEFEEKVKKENQNENPKKNNNINKPPKLNFTTTQSSIDLTGSTDMNEFFKNTINEKNLRI